MLPVTYSDCNGVVDGVMCSPSSEATRRSRSRFTSKPSWLLLSISDMEDKIQAMKGEYKPDTFGERADFYYRKRPQLLALLQDLYNRYLYLADRYTRALSKQPPQKQVHQHHETFDDNSSDHAQASLSDQSPLHPNEPETIELVMSDLVLKFVNYEIVVDELQSLDMVQEESKKKIELQRNLLEVLESERVVLINENSRLASESLFMKRKAGELARCVLMERTEDERVFALSRKIDDLQGQIHELKKRNKEYYDKLMKHQTEVSKNTSSSSTWSGEEEATTSGSICSTSNSSTCTSVAQVTKGKKKEDCTRGSGGGKKWWDRVKKFDMFMCGPTS